MKLSPHFTLEELIRSEVAARFGLPNDPTGDPDLMRNLDFLAAGLENVRAVLQMPMIVLSAYRSPAVNRSVGGARGSQHMRGLAADFVTSAFTPAEIAEELQGRPELKIDQLILEYPRSPGGGWVHVSFAEPGMEPRREVLTRLERGYVSGVHA